MPRPPWQPALSPNAWLRWEAVAARLPTGARDVLEVGCGRGGAAVRLAERYRYLGVEPDPVAASVARARLESFGIAGEVRVGDVTAAGDEQFDLVCAFEVIEHVEDDFGFVRACAARVRPGGTLLLTTPADQRKFGVADEMVGHVRRYDPERMLDVLREAHLEPVEVGRYGAPFAYVLEQVRDGIALARRHRTRALSAAERTAGSGRLLQPGDGPIAVPIWAAMLPLRKLQRVFPDRGPSLVAVARRPTSSST